MHQLSVNPDSVEFSAFSYHNLPAITSEAMMLQTLGKPDTVFTLNGSLEEARKYRPNNDSRRTMRIPIASFQYKPGITYKLQLGQTYLEQVDFRKNPAAQIFHPTIALSASTTLENIKDVFPKSYEQKNQGASLLRGFLPEHELKDYEFITLAGTSPNHIWQIELGFVDKKLSYFNVVMLPPGIKR